MYGYIYETTCNITGMKYVGMHKWNKDSIDPNYFGSGIYLVRAIEKYGKENFSCKILDTADSRKELLEKEKFYTDLYEAPINENYYNIADGGAGGHSTYYKQPVTEKQLKALEQGRHLPASDLQKKQLSERRQNCLVSRETREKLRNAQLGKVMSNSCKEKHRHKMLGSNNPNYGGISESHKQKLKENSSNRVHIHKDSINKNIKKEQLEEYLNNNWQLGYIYKVKSSTTKG